MPHYIHSDCTVLEIGRELWVIRPELPHHRNKWRGPFRSDAEVSAWIQDNDDPAIRKIGGAMEIGRLASSLYRKGR